MILLLMFIFLFVQKAEAQNMPKAKLNIEIYYFAPKENMELREAAAQLIKKAEADINIDIFRGLRIELKAAAIQNWFSEDAPIYSTAGIHEAIDMALLKQMIPTKFPPISKGVDLRLILFGGTLTECYSSETQYITFPIYGGCKRYKNILVNQLRGELVSPNTMVMGYFKNGTVDLGAAGLVKTLLHEIGHFLGINRHTKEDLCKKTPFLMCEKFDKTAKYFVFDESYKKAWRDFYYSRTGQKLEPR